MRFSWDSCVTSWDLIRSHEISWDLNPYLWGLTWDLTILSWGPMSFVWVTWDLMRKLPDLMSFYVRSVRSQIHVIYGRFIDILKVLLIISSKYQIFYLHLTQGSIHTLRSPNNVNCHIYYYILICCTLLQEYTAYRICAYSELPVLKPFPLLYPTLHMWCVPVKETFIILWLYHYLMMSYWLDTNFSDSAQLFLLFCSGSTWQQWSIWEKKTKASPY